MVLVVIIRDKKKRDRQARAHKHSAIFHILVFIASPAEPVKLSDQISPIPSYVGGVPAATRSGSATEAKAEVRTCMLGYFERMKKIRLA